MFRLELNGRTENNLKQHDLNYAELDVHVEGYKLGTAFILKKIVCTFVHFLQ